MNEQDDPVYGITESNLQKIADIIDELTNDTSIRKTFYAIFNEIRSRDPPKQIGNPLDSSINYYPISEGEIRSVLDMDHIPYDATLEQIDTENTKILSMLLNRDTVTMIRAVAKAEERERVLEEVLVDIRTSRS